MSDISIDDEILTILSLGPNFCYRSDDPKQIKKLIFDTFTSFSLTIDRSDVINKDELMYKFSKILDQHTRRMKNKKLDYPHQELLRWINKTKQFVKQHRDEIVITKADKGSKTVILNTFDYLYKANEILDDSSTYLKLKKNPILNIDAKCKKFLKHADLKSLIVQNPNVGRMYFLPKIHKDNVPLRQITSTINTPTYNLARYLHEIISKVTNISPYRVKNSFELVNEVRELSLLENHVLFSLDVVALFPSIPQELVIECIIKKWDLLSLHTFLSQDLFIEGIKLCFDSAVFCFKQLYYRQIDGTPMGSSLSGALADLVLQILEDEIITDDQYKILYYRRYVDDCLFITPSENMILIFEKFNSFHSRLKFTIEYEVNHTINFLDISLSRSNSKITTNWFRKPTASGRYINFYSHTDIQYKKNTIYALVDRAVKLSEPAYHSNNLKYIHDVLVKNGYPSSFINLHIRKRITTLQFISPIIPDNDERPVFTVLPYNDIMIPCIKKLIKNCNIKIVTTNAFNTSNLFTNMKDKLDKFSCKDLIYKVKCGACNCIYIGETSQPLSKRLYQHRYHCRLLNPDHSALTRHHQETGHIFNFEETVIVDRIKRKDHRLIHESLHINTNRKASINYQTDAYNKLKYARNFIGNFTNV